MKKPQYYGSSLVWVKIDGVMVQVNPASIDRSARKPLHGEFKGTKVNSPAMHKIGESVIVWPDESKPQAFSLSIAAAGVFSTKFLQSEGQTVAAA